LHSIGDGMSTRTHRRVDRRRGTRPARADAAIDPEKQAKFERRNNLVRRGPETTPKADALQRPYAEPLGNR
jgi:hypothetical protein